MRVAPTFGMCSTIHRMTGTMYFPFCARKWTRNHPYVSNQTLVTTMESLTFHPSARMIRMIVTIS